MSHEALIRKWKRFRDWLEEERKAVSVYRQVDELFLEYVRLCPGKPALVRCLSRFFTGSYVPRQLLRKARKYQIVDRGECWVEFYEGQRGSIVLDKAAERFGKLADYIRLSGKVSLVVRYGTISIIAASMITSVGWMFADYEKAKLGFQSAAASLELDKERVLRQVAEVSGKAFEREAEIFQPFGVGARMEQPRDAWGHTLNKSYLAALWEGAVALTALKSKYPEFRIDNAQRVDGDEKTDNDQQRRFACAARLAFGTVNEAVYSLLGLPVWDLGSSTGGGAPTATGMPIKPSNVAAPGSAEEDIYRGELAMDRNPEELYHRFQPGQGGVPGKGVYFNPAARFQFTFYSVSGGRCHLVRLNSLRICTTSRPGGSYWPREMAPDRWCPRRPW